MTTTTTPAAVRGPKAPRSRTLKQTVEQEITNGREGDFLHWLNTEAVRPAISFEKSKPGGSKQTVRIPGEGLDFIPNRQAAKSLMSAYVESRGAANYGCYFPHGGTLVIFTITRDSEGNTQERPLRVTPPLWMTDFIESFPDAAWAKKF